MCVRYQWNYLVHPSPPPQSLWSIQITEVERPALSDPTFPASLHRWFPGKLTVEERVYLWPPGLLCCPEAVVQSCQMWLTRPQCTHNTPETVNWDCTTTGPDKPSDQYCFKNCRKNSYHINTLVRQFHKNADPFHFRFKILTKYIRRSNPSLYIYFMAINKPSTVFVITAYYYFYTFSLFSII